MDDSSIVVPTESIDILNSLSYEEVPVEILDHQIRRLRNKEVPLVKVLWRNQSVEGATWEEKVDMRTKYPHLLSTNSDSDEGNSSLPILRFSYLVIYMRIHTFTNQFSSVAHFN